jgi:transglutaminase-like putative cysteine protease
MRVRVGYRMTYEFVQPTPMLITLSVHYSRTSDLVRPDLMRTDPATPYTSYRDSFGNWVNRLLAPPGTFTLSADTLVRDDGALDEVGPEAWQHAVEDLPDETLVYLLGSRYCENDKLTDVACDLFGHLPAGWPVVQAINEYVHTHITFGYEWASPTKTAWDAYQDRHGVCRDYAHLGVALCRAMNIPARYCTGYLAFIDIPTPLNPMDFAGWFEVFLGGRWWTVDPRNRVPRAGRILIARGRDAADVAITTTFGPNTLTDFRVWTDQLDDDAQLDGDAQLDDGAGPPG